MFPSRASSQWNSLPLDIIKRPSLSLFKVDIRQWLHAIDLAYFVINGLVFMCFYVWTVWTHLFHLFYFLYLSTGGVKWPIKGPALSVPLWNKFLLLLLLLYFYVVPLKNYDLKIDLILCKLKLTKPIRDPSNSKEAKAHHLLFMLESRVFASPAWTKPMIHLCIC